MIYRVEVQSPVTGKWEGPCRGDALKLPEPGKEYLLKYGENLGLAFSDLVCNRNKIWRPDTNTHKYERFVFTELGWAIVQDRVFEIIGRFPNAKWRILYAPDPVFEYDFYPVARQHGDKQATVVSTWFYQNAQEV